MRKMKNVTALLLSVLLVLSALPYAALGVLAKGFLYGDASEDGVVTAVDARYVLRAAVGTSEFEPGSDAFLASDVNGNGVITAADARFVFRMAMGLESKKIEAPVEDPALYTYAAGQTETADASLELRLGEREDEAFTVSLIAKNCVGLKSADFEIRYDPAVVKCKSVGEGSDASLLSGTKSHLLTLGNEDDGKGLIRMAFYDKDAFVKKEDYAADSKDAKNPVDVNAGEFECAVLRFEIVSENPVASKITLQMRESSGVKVSSAASFDAPAKTIPLSRGDLDGDGSVTAADARLVLRAAVGLETFDADQTFYADVDYDKAVTAADARLVLRAAVGLEKLPAPSEVKVPADDYVYLAVSDFNRIRQAYPPAEAQAGYVVAYINTNGDKCVLTYIRYKIISDFTETTLHNLVTGERIVSPAQYYDEKASHAGFGLKITYMELAQEARRKEVAAINGMSSVLTTGVNSGEGVFVDAATLNK